MTIIPVVEYFDSYKLALLIAKVAPKEDRFIAKMYAAIETVIAHEAHIAGLERADFITLLREDTTSPEWEKLTEKLSGINERWKDRISAAKARIEEYSPAIGRLNSALDLLNRNDSDLLLNHLGKAASELTHFGIRVPVIF